MPEAAQLFYTRMAELADASDLSFDASACGFDSHFEYHKKVFMRKDILDRRSDIEFWISEGR